MFLDVLDMIFDNISGVISAFDVKLFSIGGTDISFWELLLGLLVVSIIFGFFLAPRPGSVLGSFSAFSRANSNQSSDFPKKRS